MKCRFLALALAFASVACTQTEEHELYLITTGDVHGSWFDEPYTGGKKLTSLLSVSSYVNGLRDSVGADNVLLLDAGDALQGDKAPYYYNYVDTLAPHLFPRIMAYMHYDVAVLGNHDIETGHHVYDRVAAEMNAAGIKWLAGNALRTDNGKPYFPTCAMLRKDGVKIAVLGYDNANIKAWLSEELWSGMEFESLTDVVQKDVDRIRSRRHPQLVIVAVHSGTGEGDGTVLESQGLDLFKTLEGVDVLVCAHDHRPFTVNEPDKVLVNGGSHAGNVGKVCINMSTKGRKVVSKTLEASTVRMDKNRVDEAMKAAFEAEYDTVKAFTLRPVGQLAMPLRTRDAYVGMSDYLNLLHAVQLASSGAEISFAAPLTYNGNVEAGQLVYNDMFTIYPFENQMFVMKLTGAEIKSYLEYSYDCWIQTPGQHVLRMKNEADPRTGSARWSFENRSYNFDSAAGIVYAVDVTKPFGERVAIASMADGSAFDMEKTYEVAMTSYRANGGGGLLRNGCGIDTDNCDDRIVARYPEIRELLYRYVKANPEIDHELISDRGTIGQWSFVPEEVAEPLLEADMSLLF